MAVGKRYRRKLEGRQCHVIDISSVRGNRLRVGKKDRFCAGAREAWQGEKKVDRLRKGLRRQRGKKRQKISDGKEIKLRQNAHHPARRIRPSLGKGGGRPPRKKERNF